jgi:hypothetical protein
MLNELVDSCTFVGRVARFFWYKIPKRGKIYQMTIKYSKWPKIFPMAVKYTKWS